MKWACDSNTCPPSPTTRALSVIFCSGFSRNTLILVILSMSENFGHKVSIFFEINDKIARDKPIESTTYCHLSLHNSLTFNNQQSTWQWRIVPGRMDNDWSKLKEMTQKDPLNIQNINDKWLGKYSIWRPKITAVDFLVHFKSIFFCKELPFCKEGLKFP